MNKLKISFFSGVALFVSLFAANQAGAISIRELLGLDDEQKIEDSSGQGANEKTGSNQNWGKPSATSAQASLSLTELQRVLANVDVQQRQALLADSTAFKNFVTQQANNASVLTAARANKVDQDANTAFLMKRSSENILRETYLNKLITSKMPADFPSEEQSREYFDKNKEKFVVPERVHVWQVFLQVAADMDDSEVAALKKKADAISKDIRTGKVSFADAAKEHSAHEQSKVSGGYMGLLKVTELKPEIGKPLLDLPEDRTSAPIRTETGFHVVKRGPKVPALDVEFEQVSAQIKNLLRKQVATQLRQAVFEQASKTYPVNISDSEIENWRSQLTAK